MGEYARKSFFVEEIHVADRGLGRRATRCACVLHGTSTVECLHLVLCDVDSTLPAISRQLRHFQGEPEGHGAASIIATTDGWAIQIGP